MENLKRITRPNAHTVAGNRFALFLQFPRESG